MTTDDNHILTYNCIRTTAPIPITELKQYFINKDTKFLIDYHNSSLKGLKLLTYLSNLEVPVDIVLDHCTEEEEDNLMVDYFNSSALVDIQSLEVLAIEILLESRGLLETEKKGWKDFVENNKDVIQRWSEKLDSLTLYNMYTLDIDQFKEFVESHPHDDTEELEGVNFVSVLKYPEFYRFYEQLDQDNLKYYPYYFNEYAFKGRNLFYFWATENNPWHLLCFNIANGFYEGQSEEENLQNFKINSEIEQRLEAC